MKRTLIMAVAAITGLLTAFGQNTQEKLKGLSLTCETNLKTSTIIYTIPCKDTAEQQAAWVQARSIEHYLRVEKGTNSVRIVVAKYLVKVRTIGERWDGDERYGLRGKKEHFISGEDAEPSLLTLSGKHRNHVDGDTFNAKAYVSGTYQYETVNGAKATVRHL